MKKIIVEIAPDGKVTVRAEGYTGPSCVEAVKRIAAELGVADEEQHTAEFYLTAASSEEGVTVGG